MHRIFHAVAMTENTPAAFIPAPAGLTLVFEDGKGFPIVGFEYGSERNATLYLDLNDTGVLKKFDPIKSGTAGGVKVQTSAAWLPEYFVPTRILEQ